MIKVTGIKHQVGEWEKGKYDNYVFYGDFVTDKPSQVQKIGNCPDASYKVSAKVVEKSYSGKVSALMGKNIEFYFNRNDERGFVNYFTVEE